MARVWNFVKKLYKRTWEEDAAFIAVLWLSALSFIGWYWNAHWGNAGTGAVLLAKGIIKYALSLWYFVLVAMLLNLVRLRAVRRVIQAVVLLWGVVIAISDIFLIYTMGETLNQTKIAMVLGTDPQTVKEFISMYVLSLPVFFCTMAGLLIMLWVANFVGRRLSWVMTRRVGVAFLVIGFLGSTAVLSKLTYASIRAHEHLSQVKASEELTGFLYEMLRPAGVFLDMQAAMRQMGEAETVNAALEANPDVIVENESDIPYVIFILNESVDRNRMSLYGCEHDTTPFQRVRAGKGELVPFTDTISCGNGTARTMSLIFSFTEKEDKAPWYEKPVLFDVLRAAGYDVSWLSNQSPVGKFGNMDSLYAARSDGAHFVSLTGGANGGENTLLDDALLPLLDEEIAAMGEKNFCLLHLHGVHEPYNIRFSPEFAHFTEADEDAPEKKWREVKADYDNAILYNDYIIEEIIKRFEDKDAVVINLSDHGSEVYDGRDFFGHSGEETRNRHMIEVPFTVWCSKSFREKRPELFARLRAGSDRPFRSDDTIHFVLDLLGIKTEHFDPTRSPINESYQVRPRIYGGEEYKKL